MSAIAIETTVVQFDCACGAIDGITVIVQPSGKTTGEVHAGCTERPSWRHISDLMASAAKTARETR